MKESEKREWAIRIVVIAAIIIFWIAYLLCVFCLITKAIGMTNSCDFGPYWCCGGMLLPNGSNASAGASNGGGTDGTGASDSSDDIPTDALADGDGDELGEESLSECNTVCRILGYDFGIHSDVECKPPFVDMIIIDDNRCCCGNDDWPGGSIISDENDWCLDSDIDSDDPYQTSGFCVDNHGDGIWDNCIVDGGEILQEAYCSDLECVYREISCPNLQEGDGCFEQLQGALCAWL